MNPLMRFAHWLARLGWYDDDAEAAREERTEAARQRSMDRIGEKRDRIAALRASSREAGRRLTR